MFRNASARADACRRLLRGQEMMMEDEIEWGPWIDWPGGECPIPWAHEGEYCIRMRNGQETSGFFYIAGSPWWARGKRSYDYDIIAYRVRADLMSRLSRPAAPDAAEKMAEALRTALTFLPICFAATARHGAADDRNEKLEQLRIDARAALAAYEASKEAGR